jgi:uncharacterized membrane protein YccC
MAQAVAHLSLSRTRGWLAQPSPALRFGLKYGTAMAAAIWIAFATALPWGLSLWITVMFVTQPNAGASIKKGLMRIWGSVASALISIAIYGLFAQQPPLMLASLCGVLAIAIYGVTGPRYPYAWLVFGFTTIIILVKAMAGSDQIETLSFERASLTALGVLVVFVADALFWPVRAEEQLREGLAARSRQLGDTLKQHLDVLQSGQAPGKKSPPPSFPLTPQLGLAAQARGEIGVEPARVQTLTRIALLLEGLDSRARLLGRATEAEPSAPAPSLHAALERLGRDLHAALGEGSRALAEERAAEPFADELGRSLTRFEAERMAQPEAAPSALASVLRGVVALLGRLEEALVGLANEAGESKAGSASQAAPAPIMERFRLDPIRVQLALRAGIAAGGVIVLMLALGWNQEEDILAFIFAPIVAFIFAGVFSTRGAGTLGGVGWALGVLLGWLIADLASVFLFTHLDRMPLSLVYPFAIACGAGYLVVRGSPLGIFGALFGMITAVLPIFIGDGPPENVDAAYGLVCGVLLGLATGRVAQLCLWPRTAMQTFLERAAAQLELCLQALGGSEPSSDAAVRGRDAAGLVTGYAKQLSLLGQLHAQAHSEPVERALDDGRRAELLVVIQDLFDASLGADPTPSAEQEALPAETEAALAPLREALNRQAEALVASLTTAAGALRGAESEPGSDLAEARAAFESQLEALRARPDLGRGAGARRTGEFLARLAESRRLVDSHLQLEAWLAEWRKAKG